MNKAFYIIIIEEINFAKPLFCFKPIKLQDTKINIKKTKLNFIKASIHLCDISDFAE